MEAAIGLEQVLLEEDEAWRMASHIAELAARDDLGELHRELANLRGFLAGELEVHFDREEADLFPVLAKRGLEVEVEEAKSQHAGLRTVRAALNRVPEGDTVALREALTRMSEAIHQHIRYEADFIYCDLTKPEATAFREDVDRTIEKAGAARSRQTTPGHG